MPFGKFRRLLTFASEINKKVGGRNMKTNLRLKRNGEEVYWNRVAFLGTLECYEEEHEELKEVRKLAKDADEIRWSSDDEKLHFLYEEDRDFKEEKAECYLTATIVYFLSCFFEDQK